MDIFNYQIRTDRSDQVVRIQCLGMLEFHRAEQMVREARKLATALSYRLLYDFRQLELPSNAPLAVVLTFPFNAGLLPDGNNHRLRSVAIVAADQIGHPLWKAYRIASRQNGMHWNYFGSEAQAMQWLREPNHWDIQRDLPKT